jgi:hypothetical protein
VDSYDDSFVTAAHVALDLVTRPEVAARWEAPSALPEMTVGMLACHLGRQSVRAAELLPVSSSEAPLREAAEHYRRATWVRATDLDDPANDRSTDEAEASQGFAVMRDRWAEAVGSVGRLLGDGGAVDVVALPWQGWSLRRPDLLLTRMVEIVVHADDLARSIDVPTPPFPDDVFLPVLHLLAELATERHGQAAIISALSRRERMPETVSAF